MKFLKKIFNKYNEKDLAIAIENNNIEAVLDILPKLPDKYFQYNYCTYSAIKNYTQIIEILLKDERCIPQNNINEPLMKSIEYNNMESFKLLISDIRVFKTFSVEQVFEHCIRYDNFEVFDYLITQFDIDFFDGCSYCILKESIRKEKYIFSKKIIQNKHFKIHPYTYNEIAKCKEFNLFKEIFDNNRIDIKNNYCFDEYNLQLIIESCFKHENYEVLKYLYNVKEIRNNINKLDNFELKEKIDRTIMKNNLINF